MFYITVMEARANRGHARTGTRTPTPDIPKAGRRAFFIARANADRRGVEWQISLREWWDWWQTDNRWANRGRAASKFVMARTGDVGPYAIGNIYCTTFTGNRQDSGWPVSTPIGVFKNATAAARAHGLKTKTGETYATREQHWWSYLRPQ